MALLEKHNDEFEYPVHWGSDLQTEHERFLTEKVFKKPVFVTDYPKEIKAFYMRQNDDGKTVAAVDLLVPGVGELIGRALCGWLAVHSLGYFGICIANPIAWGLALLYCVFMVTRVLKKENA